MGLLVRLIQGRVLLTLAAICSSVLTSVITLCWNAQLSEIINIVSVGKPVPESMTLFALAIMICIGASTYIKGYVSGLTCENLTHDLRMGYARYFSAMPIKEIESLNAGEQMSKLQNEISDVSGYLNDKLFPIFDDFMRLITSFIWLVALNSKLTLMVNMPVVVILIYVVYSSKAISSYTDLSLQAKTRANKYADTLLNLFPVIRLYEATRMILNSYCDEVCEWERQTVRAERIKAGLMSLSGLLSNIPLMLMFFIGGGMVINGALTIGTLYIFLNLSGNVSGVMMNMPGFIAALRQFSANMKRISLKIVLVDRRKQEWE